MPLPTQSQASILARAKAFLRTSFPGLPMGPKTFLGQSGRGIGLNAWAGQKSIEDVDIDIVPAANSSGGLLSSWASLLGLPNGSGIAGQYGPLVPTTASGGAAPLTGTIGTIYTNGLVATGPDGTTQIALSGGVTIPGSGNGSGSIGAVFVAITPGSVGNLPANSVCTWQSPPPGADPTFVLTTGLSGALDNEANSAVFSRVQTRLQVPPRGGVSTDFKIWAQTVAGVVGVYVYPRRSGTGLIDVVITVGGSGVSRVPSAALIALVQTAIDNARPVGAEQANVMAPSTTSGHLLQVRVVPTSIYPFDWGSDAPGTAFTVDAGGFSVGPPATIRLTGLAPTSLKNAIQAYVNGTGAQPRLQVLSTGSVINIPVGTSKTTTWSDGGGKTTITLDTLPTGFITPSNGDTIYPYGPVVATIATNLLALIDGLGSSRQSSYGDTLNPWNDTLFLNQLARVAEDAVDATGNPLITEVIAGGALIDGSSAADVVGADNTVTAPELLFASHVAVTG